MQRLMPVHVPLPRGLVAHVDGLLNRRWFWRLGRCWHLYTDAAVLHGAAGAPPRDRASRVASLSQRTRGSSQRPRGSSQRTRGSSQRTRGSSQRTRRATDCLAGAVGSILGANACHRGADPLRPGAAGSDRGVDGLLAVAGADDQELARQRACGIVVRFPEFAVGHHPATEEVEHLELEVVGSEVARELGEAARQEVLVDGTAVFLAEAARVDLGPQLGERLAGSFPVQAQRFGRRGGNGLQAPDAVSMSSWTTISSAASSSASRS